jgi:hypothetical protein
MKPMLNCFNLRTQYQRGYLTRHSNWNILRNIGLKSINKRTPECIEKKYSQCAALPITI